MGYLAPGKMLHNMLQLMHFSVYFEGVLYTNNGYFHIKIMISAAHMLGARGHVLSKKIWKILFVLMFLCILYYRVPQTRFFACY